MYNKINPFVTAIINFFKKDNYNASLESRIYHSFCLLSIIASIVSLFINLSVGMDMAIWMSTLVFVLQSYCYYISKVKGKLSTALIISFLGFHIVLCFNYVYNAGIAGPTLLMATLTLFFIIITEKSKHAIYWFILNIIVTTSLLYLEYHDNSFIKIKYDTRKDLFIDMYFTYLIIISVIYYGTVLLKKNYQEQKKHITQKALALEKLNTEKDKLFSIISHDLRTPLANVQQYLEMMVELDLTAEEREHIEKDLLNITRNTQYLLVNLLHWSKNQMDGANINLQSCFLLHEIANTLSFMQLLANKKKIEINISLEKEHKVFVDPDILNLLIRNLLHNAIKFTPFGGLIIINSTVVENNCIISIKDNGTGIPLDQQKEIFTLKAKTTFGTNKEKGTGIGLMLCKEYVELQQGKIWFESVPKEGTTFYMSFKIDAT